jgi:hypothetical protein
MGGGTLKRLVYDQMMAGPRAIYTDAAALSMGLQVARGLRYLHNSMPMVRPAAAPAPAPCLLPSCLYAMRVG